MGIETMARRRTAATAIATLTQVFFIGRPFEVKVRRDYISNDDGTGTKVGSGDWER
jgi:hypothetical protein